MQFLFSSTCHRLRRVHLLARKQIDAMMATFPQLLWNKYLLRLLLDILQQLFESCDKDYGIATTMTTGSANDRTERSARGTLTVDLPDDLDYRKELLASFSTLCTHWLQTALKQGSAGELQSLLHVRLSNKKIRSPTLILDLGLLDFFRFQVHGAFKARRLCLGS